MTDDKKLTLGSRPPLGIKKTIEAGKVKQSFSHGRSKTVMVEVKKRRVLKRPGEEEQREEASAAEATAPVGVVHRVAQPEPPAPAPAPAPAPEPAPEPAPAPVAEPEAAAPAAPEPTPAPE